MTLSLFQSDRTRERIELVSRIDFEQPLTREQRRVVELLTKHMGKSRAITIREIGMRLDMTAREIKERVSELRAQPFMLPLCASRSGEHGGYYMASSDDERREAAMTLIHQAHAMMLSASHLLEPHELASALGPILASMQGEAHV